MLRHRLAMEENGNKELQGNVDKLQKANVELEEQLRMYEVLVKKSESNQFSSTPLNAATAHMGRERMEFKTPISR